MLIWKLGGGSSGFSRGWHPPELEVRSGRAGSFHLRVSGFVFFVASEAAADISLVIELLRGEKDVLWETT